MAGFPYDFPRFPLCLLLRLQMKCDLYALRDEEGYLFFWWYRI